MTTATAYFNDAETWLDKRGKGAWIAATIVAFILFWPLGLALLAYSIWSKRMSCTKSDRFSKRAARGGSGNLAFDAYRNETLKRLEQEQDAFRTFMDRLQTARDKAEFDQFMTERRSAPQQPFDADADLQENSENRTY